MENAASICLMAADTAFLHTVFGFGALACPFVSCSRARLGRHRAEIQFSACQISGAGSDFGARVEVPHAPTETELSVAVWSDVFDSCWLIAVAGL